MSIKYGSILGNCACFGGSDVLLFKSKRGKVNISSYLGIHPVVTELCGKNYQIVHAVTRLSCHATCTKCVTTWTFE